MNIKNLSALIGVVCIASIIIVPLGRAQAMPHAIFGFIKDSAGNPVAGATIALTNDRTGGSMSVTSNSLGQYQADLFTMPSGYQVGDSITLKANSGKLEGTSSVTVSADALDQCDVIVSEKTASGSLVILGIVAVIMIVVALAALTIMRKPPVKKSSEKGRRRERK